MYLLWSLVSAFSTASYLVYISGLLKTHRSLHPNTALLGSHLVGGLLMLVAAFALPSISFIWDVDSNAYGYLFINALLLMLSRELYLYAYAHTDVANITIFSPLTPLFAIATGHFLLGETLTAYEWIGTVLICGAIYLLFLQPNPQQTVRTTLFSPFAHIIGSKPIFCGFLSTIPTAFAAVYQKKALQSFDPATFTVLLLLTLAAMASIAEIIVRRKPLAITHTKLHWWLIAGSLMIASQFIFCFILNAAPTAVALILQRLSVIFQVWLAYIFLKEKTQIGKRLVCSISAVIGAAFIIYRG